MKIGISTITRVCGAFTAILLVGISGFSSEEPSQAITKKQTNKATFISITSKTVNEAFQKAAEQDSKITGCWMQKDSTWVCTAKVNPSVSDSVSTISTTSNPVITTATTNFSSSSSKHRGKVSSSGGVVTTLVSSPTTTTNSTTTSGAPTTTKPTTTTKATTTTTKVTTTTKATTTTQPTNGVIPGTVGPTSSNLTAMSTLTITQNGAVVENVNVTGEIRVKANNVTIRNFRANNVYKEPANTGLLLEDGEIHGQQNNTVNGVVWSDYTARRLNVYNVEDGFKAHGNVLIENCWVHDLAFFNNGGTWTHNDGVQISSGSNVTVRNSRFERIQGTAAIFIKPDQGDISNVTITNNILGGGAYTLYSQSKNGSNPTNISISNNTFLIESLYGYLYIDNPNTVVTGNKNINGQVVS